MISEPVLVQNDLSITYLFVIQKLLPVKIKCFVTSNARNWLFLYQFTKVYRPFYQGTDFHCAVTVNTYLQRPNITYFVVYQRHDTKQAPKALIQSSHTQNCFCELSSYLD